MRRLAARTEACSSCVYVIYCGLNMTRSMRVENYVTLPLGPFTLSTIYLRLRIHKFLIDLHPINVLSIGYLPLPKDVEIREFHMKRLLVIFVKSNITRVFRLKLHMQ